MFERLKSYGVNIVALGFAVMLMAAYFIRHDSGAISTQHSPWIISMALSFFASIFNYWRLLKITEAPISTIAAAAQGYVELYGKANTEKPLKTPYQDISCVWYRASVYANREDKEEDFDLLNLMPLEYSESKTTFNLDDGTGQCMVNPQGAEVIYFEARTWRKNDHRYVEEYLPVNTPLYVIGQLDTRKDVPDEAAINREVGIKLTDWKKRPQQLLNRYDQNQNGQIDMEEWELARQDAIAEVKAEFAMRANAGTANGKDFTLAKPNGKHLFLISAKSPMQLRNGYKIWAALHAGLLITLLYFYTRLS
jgi:hypothetical protein